MENGCAIWRLFARKLPVLIVFAMDVVISTSQPMVESKTFSIIAALRALDSFRTCR